MRRAGLKDDDDDGQSTASAWSSRTDARRSANAAVPLPISPALLKRRRLRTIGIALALATVYLVLRRLGWLDGTFNLSSHGRHDTEIGMAESQGWLDEKWFLNFRANRTQQRAANHVDEDDKADAELYGRRQGSSVLTRGSLQGPGERAESAAINLDHLHNWLRFATSHEVYDADDRISFAQMSFQTATYARLLRHISEVPESLVQEFEEKLWFFVPGLEQLRTAHNHVAGQPQPTSAETAQVGGDFARRKGGGGRLRRMVNRLGSRLLRRDTPTDEAHHYEEARVDAENAAAPTRGIVIVAGDDHFPFALQLIATIRDAHHCDIPIELFYYDDDDLSEENRAYIEHAFADVRTVSLAELDVYDSDFSMLRDSTYSMRSFALLASNFTEAMLLDADTVLTIDPHDFFSERGYSAMGTLFFRDVVALDMTNDDAQKFVSAQLGLRRPSEQLARSAFWRRGLAHHQDSGVVVVNKAKANVFAALVFAVWQNSAWIREQVTYKTFFGDKETYWFAFELAELPYHFSPYDAGAIGAEQSILTRGFCAEHTLHLLDTQITHTHAPAEEGHEVSSSSTSVKHELRKRRVAWWNGSLLKSRQQGAELGELEAASTLWTLDGRWSWKNETMCLKKYTPHSAQELDISPSLEVLLDVGSSALQRSLSE